MGDEEARSGPGSAGAKPKALQAASENLIWLPVQNGWRLFSLDGRSFLLRAREIPAVTEERAPQPLPAATTGMREMSYTLALKNAGHGESPLPSLALALVRGHGQRGRSGTEFSSPLSGARPPLLSQNAAGRGLQLTLLLHTAAAGCALRGLRMIPAKGLWGVLCLLV